MLSQPAPFPHAGSYAFIAPDAAPARIQRTNPDGTALVTLLPGAGASPAAARALRTNASGNKTVAMAQLFGTAEEAILGETREASAKPPHHKRARRPSAR